MKRHGANKWRVVPSLSCLMYSLPMLPAVPRPRNAANSPFEERDLLAREIGAFPTKVTAKRKAKFSFCGLDSKHFCFRKRPRIAVVAHRQFVNGFDAGNRFEKLPQHVVVEAFNDVVATFHRLIEAYASTRRKAICFKLPKNGRLADNSCEVPEIFTYVFAD